MTSIRSRPGVILCADWGKAPRKRAVFVADISSRAVRRLSAREWSLDALLKEAGRWAKSGPVVATLDLPLGVPASYLTAASEAFGLAGTVTFVDLLARAHVRRGFFDPTSSARDWSVMRPFFAVPAGKGGLTSYVNAAREEDVELLRGIDRQTRAKPVFVTSGIPGSVGSGASSLWSELGPKLSELRDFSVWPFEGRFDALLEDGQIVLAEIYPRVAYAAALLDEPPASRPPLAVAKTKEDVRRSAVARLSAAEWPKRLGVVIEDLEAAQANEDDFDACLTAAALVRCVLEGTPLASSETDSVAEGGILGMGAVNFELGERVYERSNSRRVSQRPKRRPSKPTTLPLPNPGSRKTHHCSIPGCEKTFFGSRGGWDGHVGSLRIHPNWHPRLTHPADRRQRFRQDYPEFFGK